MSEPIVRAADGKGRAKGWSEEAEDDFVRAWTREEAQAWRAKSPQVSPWRIVAAQALIGLVVAALAGAVSGASESASALYGAAVVVIPAALMARGMTSRLASLSPATSFVSVMVWESVKVMVTVLMLALAPRVVQPLSWPALLIALVACMLGYGFALLWRGRKN